MSSSLSPVTLFTIKDGRAFLHFLNGHVLPLGTLSKPELSEARQVVFLGLEGLIEMEFDGPSLETKNCGLYRYEGSFPSLTAKEAAQMSQKVTSTHDVIVGRQHLLEHAQRWADVSTRPRPDFFPLFLSQDFEAIPVTQIVQGLPAVRQALYPIIDRLWAQADEIEPFSRTLLAYAIQPDITMTTQDRSVIRIEGIRTKSRIYTCGNTAGKENAPYFFPLLVEGALEIKGCVIGHPDPRFRYAEGVNIKPIALMTENGQEIPWSDVPQPVVFAANIREEDPLSAQLASLPGALPKLPQPAASR